jgi:beta-galactosidase
VEDAKGPQNPDKGYLDTCQRHYQAFWRMGIPVDVIDMEQAFSGYKLVVAPMLYMVRPGVGERMEAFVQAGGTLVATYWSGIVDETDLCFLGGFPGPLRSVLGIWDEEIDALTDADRNSVSPLVDNALGLTAVYEAYQLCGLIHTETASVLATYDSDFYAGRPAITVNQFGEGEAYYIAFRTTTDALTDFYGKLAQRAHLKPVIETDLPPGVNVQVRTDGERDYVFIMNFNSDSQSVTLDDSQYTDKLNGQPITGQVSLEPYGVRILERSLS